MIVISFVMGTLVGYYVIEDIKNWLLFRKKQQKYDYKIDKYKNYLLRDDK